jgi:hypothetical protein
LQLVKLEEAPSWILPLLQNVAGLYDYRDRDREAVEVLRDWLEEREGERPSVEYAVEFARHPPETRTYLVSGGWDPSWSKPVHVYEEWFARDLKGIADSIGSTRQELVQAFTSEDPLQRAWAYEAVGGYHGFENLDTDPLRGLTEKQLDSRWSS